MTGTHVNVIAGDKALAEFRQGLTGPYALALLAAAAWGVLVQLPVGVGKTEWLVKIIVHALGSVAHDLVVVLVPRRDILNELLKRLPPGLKRVVLTPRPRKQCGDLDGSWQQYEQQGLGFLGRAQLCGACIHHDKCPWPVQYGSRLQGAKLILATQQHLTLNPAFILHLKQQTRANNPLVLIDESNLLIRPAERNLRAEELKRFISAQEAHLAQVEKLKLAESGWLDLSHLVTLATTPDLREGQWQFPWVDAEWATSVQMHGVQLFGSNFRFLGYELHHFAHSDPSSRERLPGGDIRFASLPYLGAKFVVFSGSMAKELARYRLDPDHARPALVTPFEDFRFGHPDTRWFNINSMAGAAKYFAKNAGRILDFFAVKIARNIAAGKRTLLVARKKFLRLCQRLLRERLAALGVSPVKIVTGCWKKHDLNNPRTVALINYGVSGLNRFEHVECAYCLTSYYVTADVVSKAVQDIEATTERYPVSIIMWGEPLRRRVKVELPDCRLPILPRVAQQVLEQVEADVVLQGVGRTRPFTRPREIITFQGDSLPGVQYTLEFRTLEQARKYFKIQTLAQTGLQVRVEHAWRMRAQGCSRGEIAQALNVSHSTVKRYLRR